MALLQARKKHHRRSTGRSSKKNVLERFVTSYLFKFSGIVVVLFGVFYTLISLDVVDSIKGLILRLFQVTDAIKVMPENTTGFLTTIILYFLPGFLFSILSVLLSKRFGFFAYVLSIFSALYFIFIQGRIIYNYNYGGAYYSNILMADAFLIVSIVILFASALLLKRPFILILANIYLFLSLLVVIFMFGVLVDHLLIVTLLFTIGIAFASGRVKNHSVILINFIITIGFVGLIWLRKLAVNTQIEYLSSFFIYGTVFYVLFYIIISYSSRSKENTMPEWMVLTLALANLAFYTVTISFTIIKYFSVGHLFVFALGLLLINLTGLYLSAKTAINAWKFQQHLIILILASLLLPLVVTQSFVLLFSAGLSILMLGYFNYAKNQKFIFVSMVALGIMILAFFLHWIFVYFPAIVLNKSLPSGTAFLIGFLNSLVVISAMTLNYWFVKNTKVSLPKNLFNKTRYIHFLKGLILLSLFLTTGWIVTNLIYFISGSMTLATPGLFISGSLFFILLILIRADIYTYFYKPMLFLAAGFTMAFSLMVELSMSENLNTLMQQGILPLETVLFHYIAIGLGSFLALLIMVNVYKLYPKNKFVKMGLQLIGFIFTFFILFSEYDNLSVLLRAGELMANPSAHFGNELYDYNHRLPYSIMLLFSSIVIIIWALFKHQYFIRNAAILVFTVTILKIFFYDFTLVGDVARIVLFFFIGFLILGISFLYPRLKRAASGTRSQHRHHHTKSHRRKLPEEVNTTNPNG